MIYIIFFFCFHKYIIYLKIFFSNKLIIKNIINLYNGRINKKIINKLTQNFKSNGSKKFQVTSIIIFEFKTKHPQF